MESNIGSGDSEENYPVASDEAKNLLSEIEPSDLQKCLFVDNLVTVSDSGKEIGEFTVNIQTAPYYDTPAFLIHANSHGSIDKVPCGTSITAYVSPQLETLEHQHHEYVNLDQHPLDRKTFITNFNNRIVINRIITQGQNVQRTEHVFKSQELCGFISEASNLLLQRLLVTKYGENLPENLSFLSLDSDVNLCKATYTAVRGQQQALPSGRTVTVIGLERIIHSMVDSSPTTWQAFFLPSSHMTSRVQVGSPVSMKLMKDPVISVDGVSGHSAGETAAPQQASPKSADAWKADIEIFSKFLERKEAVKCQYTAYMRQHPELKALLADFLQMVLLRKPANVAEFASDYFKSFSARAQARDEIL